MLIGKTQILISEYEWGLDNIYKKLYLDKKYIKKIIITKKTKPSINDAK
jgi:hypothetical protein